MKKISMYLLIGILCLSLVSCKNKDNDNKNEPPIKDEDKVGDQTLEDLNNNKDTAISDAIENTKKEIEKNNGMEYKLALGTKITSKSLVEGTNISEEYIYNIKSEMVIKQQYFKLNEETVEVTGAMSIEIATSIQITLKYQGIESSNIVRMNQGIYIKDNMLYIYQSPLAIANVPEIKYQINLEDNKLKEFIDKLKELTNQTNEENQESLELSISTVKELLEFVEALVSDPVVSIVDNKAVYHFEYNDQNLKQLLIDYIVEQATKIYEKKNENDPDLEINKAKYIEELKTKLDDNLNECYINKLNGDVVVDALGVIDSASIELNLDINKALKISLKQDSENISSEGNSNIDLKLEITKEDFTSVEIVIPEMEYESITLEDIYNQIKALVENKATIEN